MFGYYQCHKTNQHMHFDGVLLKMKDGSCFQVAFGDSERLLDSIELVVAIHDGLVVRDGFIHIGAVPFYPEEFLRFLD